MSFPIGIQVYSVREDAKNDLLGTLKQLKEMGYDGVEFAGLYGYSATQIKQMCEEIGLVPISAHVPIKDFQNDLKGTVAAYKEIGCKYIAIPWAPVEYRPDGEKFGEFVELLRNIGAEANAQGMQLLYHNHDFEFAKLDGKYCLDVLYETVERDLLKPEFDTCWVKVGGADPCEYLGKYAGDVDVVHLKDFYGSKSESMYELIGVDSKNATQENTFELRPVGYGYQDFKAIISAAAEAGSKWLIVEQDQPSMGKTPLECAKMSREYLKSIGY